MCHTVMCTLLRKECDELNTCEGFILESVVISVRVIAHVSERGDRPRRQADGSGAERETKRQRNSESGVEKSDIAW